MVAARAWCRVDLAGGTLDIWPLGVLHPGARTVNVAIGVAATVRLARRDRTYRVRQGERLAEGRTAAELATHPEGALAGTVLAALDAPPVEVEIRSASPRGGGLGGSSAIAVALLAAAEELTGAPRSAPERAARLLRDLEARLMGLPTGVQDHYPALVGGALETAHPPGGHRVRRLDADLAALGAALLVVYTGDSHFSAGNNWQVVRRRLDGDRETAALFAGIAEVAAEVPAALEGGDLLRVGALMAREWSLRRRLAEGISTPAIEHLLETARALGAWGGKACGAGGGGCLAILAPPERRQAIAAALGAAGGTVLDAPPRGEPLWVGAGEPPD
jgi:D-glycero-alpha-D-manno-heptose-7-phosphate kinase